MSRNTVTEGLVPTRYHTLFSAPLPLSSRAIDGSTAFAWLEPDQPEQYKIANTTRQAASIQTVPYQLASPSIRRGIGYSNCIDFVVPIIGHLPIAECFVSQ